MANLKQREFAKEGYFPLDNSAVFIASVTGKATPYVYRLSCELKVTIFLPDLEAAFDSVLESFPSFRTELRPGIFWYYLEPLKIPSRLMADSLFPVEYHRLSRMGKYLFRVRVYDRRISCEFHHCLTDGKGATEFLKALVAEYLKRQGLDSHDWDQLTRPGSPRDPEEYEDAYARIARKNLPLGAGSSKAFNLPGRRYRGNAYRCITGTASVREALKAAKDRGVSLTALLAACQLAALQSIAEKSKAKALPIRLQLPVNLRSFYPSRSLRNFFLCITLDIDPRLGHYEFKEILQRVRCQMELNLGTKELDKLVFRNVRGELNLISRIIPLFLKNIVLRIISRLEEGRSSGSLSNLGPVLMPESFADHIERFDFLPSRNAISGANVVVVSWQDRLSISVGSLVEDRGFEREFFRSIASLGIALTIDANI